MSLQPCKTCEGEVAANASWCPHCGAQNPTAEPNSILKMLLLCFGLLFVAPFVVIGCLAVIGSAM